MLLRLMVDGEEKLMAMALVRRESLPFHAHLRGKYFRLTAHVTCFRYSVTHDKAPTILL